MPYGVFDPGVTADQVIGQKPGAQICAAIEPIEEAPVERIVDPTPSIGFARPMSRSPMHRIRSRCLLVVHAHLLIFSTILAPFATIWNGKCPFHNASVGAEYIDTSTSFHY